MSKHRGSKSCPDLCVLRKVRLRCIQKTSQPVEKLPAELPGKQMSLTALRESENGKVTKMGNKEE
jgi:hypothetical protein